MPVHLRPDELIPVPPRESPAEEPEGEDLAPGTLVGFRANLPVLVVAGVLLAVGIRAMRRILLAADHFLEVARGDHWQETWSPAMLFGFFGAVFGAASAWCVSLATGLSGRFVWLLAGACAAVLAVVGAVTCLATFGGTIPTMCLYCLGIMVLAATGGAYLVTKWNE